MITIQKAGTQRLFDPPLLLQQACFSFFFWGGGGGKRGSREKTRRRHAVIGQLQGFGRRHTADVLPPSFQSSFSHSQKSGYICGHGLPVCRARGRHSCSVSRQTKDWDRWPTERATVWMVWISLMWHAMCNSTFVSTLQSAGIQCRRISAAVCKALRS